MIKKTHVLVLSLLAVGIVAASFLLFGTTAAQGAVCQNTNRPYILSIGRATDEDVEFERIKAAGGTATGIATLWYLAEKNRGDAYDFSVFDTAYSRAKKYGLDVFEVLITVTPTWAKEGNLPEYKAQPKREYTEDYKRFLRAFAQKYPEIKRYSYWNEPNGCSSSADMCGNTDDSVREYAYWLDVTYNTLKEIDPNNRLAVGGIDGADLAFIDRLHNSPGGRSYDAFSVHPYNWKGPADLEGVKRVYEKVQKPIVISEYGWDVGGRADRQISPDEAANYLAQTLDKLLSPEYSFVEVASFHIISDLKTELIMGLTDAQGNPRKTHEVFKQYASRYCPPQTNPAPAPDPPAPDPVSTPPVLTPAVECTNGAETSATFSWPSHELAKKYILRIDQKNTCKNEKNEPITWLCGVDQGFPNNTGDQYYLLDPAQIAGLCSNGTCSITQPISANLDYTGASIQWVLEDNNTTADASRTGSSQSFTCTGPAPEPLAGDFDNNQVVDIFDYNVLYKDYATDACIHNLSGQGCLIDQQDLTFFKTLFGIRRN